MKKFIFTMTNIGENIKKIRELKNLTQESMAILLGVSQKTYSNIENAGNNITYEKILRIAEILEVNITKVLELNTEVLLNNNNQQGGINQLNTAVSYNYLNEEQAKLYERLLEEKDNIIKLLKEKNGMKIN